MKQFCTRALLGILLMMSTGAASIAQTADKSAVETALRKNVMTFYVQMKLQKYDNASKYVTSNTLENFKAMPKGDFIAAEVGSIAFNKELTSAKVVVNLLISLANIPAPMPLPRDTEWKLEDGIWKIVIPQQADESAVELMFSQTSKPLGPPPKFDLTFSQPELDLSPIKQGEKKLARYSFQNTTDHPVTIVDMKSDCSCIVLKSEKSTIKPGEKGEVVIEFDSKDYKYEYSQTVAVITEPGKQQINLLLKANIVPLF